ncbi:MAG: fructose-bisphosphatase class II, partial [Pseudomonadota bacterium]
SATGVTDGSMLRGVSFGSRIKTETVVMRSATKTVRWITTEHQVQPD